MKLTHIAIGGIVLLLIGAGFLLVDSANDKKLSQLQQEKKDLADQILKMRQPQPPAAAPVAVDIPAESIPEPVVATTAPAPVKKATGPAPIAEAAAPKFPVGGEPGGSDIPLGNPTRDMKLAADEKALLDAQIQIDRENAPAPPTLNPLQLKIKSLPAIAKIKTYNPQLGFVELDAGKNRQLEKGLKFNIRRDAMLIGKIVISDTVEEALCIADVDPRTVPVGVVLQKGDEIVQYE